MNAPRPSPEELVAIELKALREAAGDGVTYMVQTAVKTVKPSPAAFWKFVGELLP